MSTETTAASNVGNLVIKRRGVTMSGAYKSITTDLTEAFQDCFDGISIPEDTTGNDFRIYLDTQKTFYLSVVPQTASGAAMRLYYTDKATGNINSNSLIIDGGTRGSYISYNIIRTKYGVAFTTLPAVDDNTTVLNYGYLQSFFSNTFKDENGNSVNGYIFSQSSADATSSTGKICMYSEVHTTIEEIPNTSQFFGKTAAQTVMCNAVSYSYPIVAEHLFKKLQTEGAAFGKLKINGRTFYSGSHYALECEED